MRVGLYSHWGGLGCTPASYLPRLSLSSTDYIERCLLLRVLLSLTYYPWYSALPCPLLMRLCFYPLIPYRYPKGEWLPTYVCV